MCTEFRGFAFWTFFISYPGMLTRPAGHEAEPRPATTRLGPKPRPKIFSRPQSMSPRLKPDTLENNSLCMNYEHQDKDLS